MDNPKRARSWKRRIQPRVNLRIVEPVLYSTLLIHYGTADAITPMSEIERIKKTLERHQKPYELYLYENADHAFVNDMHQRYHKEAAEASWPRTVEFLRRHLSQGKKEG